MGIYRDQLLPRFQDKVMDRKATHKVRARVCSHAGGLPLPTASDASSSSGTRLDVGAVRGEGGGRAGVGTVA